MQIEDFIEKVIHNIEYELSNSVHFKPIEIIEDNPNEYQNVSKYGIEIRPNESHDNSSEFILEFIAIKRSEVELTRASIWYETGTKEQILKALKNKDLPEKFNSFISKKSQDFLLEDY